MLICKGSSLVYICVQNNRSFFWLCLIHLTSLLTPPMRSAAIAIASFTATVILLATPARLPPVFFLPGLKLVLFDFGLVMAI